MTFPRLSVPATALALLLAVTVGITACDDKNANADDTATAETVATETDAAADRVEMTATEANKVKAGKESASELNLDATPTGKWQERAMGNPDAPVKIIEYASMTCIHCATFNKEVKPAIKKYVDEGKVYFIYRDFPSDFLALEAAQLSRCMPENRYFPFVDVIFNRRDYWIDQEQGSARLKQLAGLAGLSEDAAKECLEDKELETTILNKRTEALTKYNVNATPTVIVNGKNKGSLTKPEEMVKLIEGAL